MTNDDVPGITYGEADSIGKQAGVKKQPEPVIPSDQVFEAMAHQGANAVRLAIYPQAMQPRLRCEWDVFGGWRWVNDR